MLAFGDFRSEANQANFTVMMSASPRSEPPVSPAQDPAADLPTPSQMASFLAAKLCHDFASPAGAVINGLHMMRDPDAQDMREDFLVLVESSARKLLTMVHFGRVAYGAATSAESFSSAEIEALAQSVFGDIRPELGWTSAIDHFSKPQARAVLNLAQIAGGTLALGGRVELSVTVEGTNLRLRADASGPRARLKAETATGLAGETLTEGLAGQWTQPYWLHTVVHEAGGRLAVDVSEDRVVIQIEMPA